MLISSFIYFLTIIFFLGLLPAMVVGGGLALDWALHLGTVIYYMPYNLILTVILVSFGLFWMIWSLFSLRNIGKGNPQEFFGREVLSATQKLVVVGPYHYTRNPMGFGWFVVVAGIGVFLGSVSTLLIAIPVFWIMVVLYLRSFEEKKLVDRFGDEYLSYRKKVPMLIPYFRKP